MVKNKKDRVIYKREKGKIEIEGASNQINNQIWFDLFTTKLIDLIFLVIFLFFASKITLVAIAIKFLKDKI